MTELCFIRNFKKRSYLVQIHTFWKLVHVLFVHNILVAIGGSEREVNWRNRIIRAPREDYFEIINDYQTAEKQNLAKFTGNHIDRSLSFNKVADLWHVVLFKKSPRRKCFPVNFTKFLTRLFLMNTSGGCFY